MEGIQVSVEKVGPKSDISIIRVGGYIDTTTSSELERALDSLLKAGVTRIIIDLGNVDYISSAGWGIFISEIKGIRERGGDLNLARMIPDVYEVFELLEFHYILKAYDTIEEAMKGFQQGGEISTEIEEESVESSVEETFSVEDDDSEDEIVDASIEVKVKKLAIENPDWGASKIAKALNSDEYGYIKVGTLSIWKMLKRLNLGNKKQRLNASGG